jgi:hypothetical protein
MCHRREAAWNNQMEGSPLLLPEDASCRWWHGYIRVLDREYRVRVGHTIPIPIPSIGNATPTPTPAPSNTKDTSAIIKTATATQMVMGNTESKSISDSKRAMPHVVATTPTSLIPLPTPPLSSTTSMISIDVNNNSITVGGVQLWCDAPLHRLLRGHQPMLLQVR